MFDHPCLCFALAVLGITVSFWPVFNGLIRRRLVPHLVQPDPAEFTMPPVLAAQLAASKIKAR